MLLPEIPVIDLKPPVRFSHSSFKKGMAYEYRQNHFHSSDGTSAASRVTADGSLLITTPKHRSDRVWDYCHIHEYTGDELRTLLANFFLEVRIVFFCPLFWSKLYATKYGWWLVRFFCRYFPNPFLNVGSDSDKYAQMLALCRRPR